MIGGVQPQSSERLGGPLRAAARGRRGARGRRTGGPGGHGRAAVARRTSGSQLPARPRGAQAAFNDAALGQGRLCTQRPRATVAQRALGASAPRDCVGGLAEIAHCGDEYGSRSCRGSKTTARSGRLQIGQKEARRSARGLRRAAARHPRQRRNVAEWRRGFAAGGECLDVQRPESSSEPTRLCSCGDRASKTWVTRTSANQPESGK
jgi:hypothetical protein